MTQSAAADRIGEKRLLNRELSSLDFYARILELAADAGVPLLERVRFLSIFSERGRARADGAVRPRPC